MNIDINLMLDALCLAVYSDSDETRLLLSKLVELYNAYKKKNQDSVDTDMAVFFTIIDDILHAEVDLSRKAEKSKIVLRIRKSPLAQRDKTLVDNVVAILEEDPANIKPSRVKALTTKIRQWIILTKTKQEAQKIMLLCNRFDASDSSQNDSLISTVLEHAHTISTIDEISNGNSETIDTIDMTNPESIKRVTQMYREKRATGVFKTGLKQLNKMLGASGGFLRGEFAAFAASSHNFKSGILMKCARWFCTKSDIAVPKDQTPCVVFISLENEIPENANNLIKEAYIDIYRQPVPETMTDNELIDRVTDYYNRKHIKFIMYRFDEMFAFTDFVQLMTRLKASGNCVIATIIDYITLMRLEGDERDNQAKRLQILASHFRNYAKRHDMLIVTGLQLNTFADELNASGKTNIVRLYRSYHLSDCRGLIRELDILIFMFIEENQDGVPYLTMAWNKHRDADRPVRSDKFAAYRFHPVMGILEDEGTDLDLNKEDIYADDLPTEEEKTALFGTSKSKQTQEPKPEDLPLGAKPVEEYVFK